MQPGRPEPSEAAVIMSTCLSGAIFDRARVRGYFHDCLLSDTSLVDADFSQSDFAGNDDHNLFARAKLIRTKFHHASIGSAKFDKAIVEEADFLGAQLSPGILAHLQGRDAVHVGT